MYHFDIDTKKQFCSLTDLVSHYRRNAIKAKEIKTPITLGVGVNKKTISVDEDWYMPDMKRDAGGELLMKYKRNGSFFIRCTERLNVKNEDGQLHVYTLTFFMINNIYYAKIFVEEENYTLKYFVNNKDFASLKDVIGYYKEKSVFKSQKLTVSLKSLMKNEPQLVKQGSNDLIMNKSYVLSKLKTGSSLLPLNDGDVSRHIYWGGIDE
jgi:hypothetical protein